MAHRLIPDNLDTVRKMVAIHTDSRNSVDDKRFAKLTTYVYHAKDSDDRKSLFTRLIDALNSGEYDISIAN